MVQREDAGFASLRWEFDSPSFQNGRIAKSGWRQPCKLEIMGSIPIASKGENRELADKRVHRFRSLPCHAAQASVERRRLGMAEVSGSIPECGSVPVSSNG